MQALVSASTMIRVLGQPGSRGSGIRCRRLGWLEPAGGHFVGLQQGRHNPNQNDYWTHTTLSEVPLASSESDTSSERSEDTVGVVVGDAEGVNSVAPSALVRFLLEGRRALERRRLPNMPDLLLSGLFFKIDAAFGFFPDVPTHWTWPIT